MPDSVGASNLEGRHMMDTPPSANPMPAEPVAAVQNPAAPFPPADSRPVFEPPSVMDPVSNLDFLPVDDAFALEMRSGTIEQLVGGDALRRGESERIEAGRSQANADRVAGRDRVRVQGTLLEHTGHGLAEQAAHLHTTVDGVLDVHAANEDTVLLAGHMRDLWDGGAAIVAAMTDDTVAGGGIRVTTPLDLWVHGLMGVEERIGTCTADAVLMELGATHYEREYGPGVHAAGLAVYTGSLYQSSRSTFRALMRVSSGVRNLIAGGGGGGGGGDAGAGGAPAASPPPAPAAGGAGAQAASETLCAATGAGGTAQAGVMAGVRPEDLTGIHRVDEVAAFTRGADVAGASGDLSELHRGADTAGQLEALRDAMRGAGVDVEGEVRSGSRVSELTDTASVHEACALDIVADIRSGTTVPTMDAPVRHSAVSRRQLPPGVKLGLLGGADRPPDPGAWKFDFFRLNERLRNLRGRYQRLCALSKPARVFDFEGAIERISNRLLYQLEMFGGKTENPGRPRRGFTAADLAFFDLGKIADQAECDDKVALAAAIREVLEVIRTGAIEELQWLSTKYNLAEAPAPQAMLRPPAAAGSPVTIPSTTVAPPGRLDIHGPAPPIVVEATAAFPQPPGGLVHATDVSGPPPASGLPAPSLAEAAGTESPDLGRGRLDPPATVPGATAAHPAATGVTVTPSLAGPTAFWLQPANPVPGPGTVPFDSRLYYAGESVRPPPVATAPSSTAAHPAATGATVTPSLGEPSSLRLQPADPVPAPGTASTTDPGLFDMREIEQLLGMGEGVSHPAPLPPPSAPGRTGAGSVAPPPGADPWRIRPPGMSGGPDPVAFGPWPAPPGSSTRVVYAETMRAPVMSTGAPPGWQGAETPGFARAASGAVELPFSRREAIARRFSRERRVFEAEQALFLGHAETLGWPAARVLAVLDDLYRLNAIAHWDSVADAAMADVDWRAIEVLVDITDAPPPSP